MSKCIKINQYGNPTFGSIQYSESCVSDGSLEYSIVEDLRELACIIKSGKALSLPCLTDEIKRDIVKNFSEVNL